MINKIDFSKSNLKPKSHKAEKALFLLGNIICALLYVVVSIGVILLVIYGFILLPTVGLIASIILWAAAFFASMIAKDLLNASKWCAEIYRDGYK